MLQLIVFSVIAYLVGSLSTAVIVCKFFNLPDPRTQGSQNPGATNVLRIGGKRAALITLTSDMLKGLALVLVAHIFGMRDFSVAFVGLAVFLGHLFPIFFKFKGGKGVATACGVIFGLSWNVGILVLLNWIIFVLLFRYSSLAAIVSAILVPICILVFTDHYAYVFPLTIMVVLLLWKHLPNIQRLRSGTESKIKFSKFRT